MMEQVKQSACFYEMYRNISVDWRDNVDATSSFRQIWVALVKVYVSLDSVPECSIYNFLVWHKENIERCYRCVVWFSR